MLKEAYKREGFWIGNDGKGIFVSNGCWAVWVMEGNLTKKNKASIIELSGQIPEAGEVFKVKPEGNQMVMNETVETLQNIYRYAISAKEKLYDTRIMIEDTGERILQSELRVIYTAREDWIRAVSRISIEADEGLPEGPVKGVGDAIYYFNESMAFAVYPFKRRETKLIKYLEMINIEDYKGRDDVSEEPEEKEEEDA